MASSIDAKGQLVNPRFSFPQTEPQITAIAQVGNVKGSQLTITWYKTSDDGDEKLFEHQITVKSHDRAFSVAKNPGGIFSAGTYKVVATLEGQTKDTEFDVTPPKAAQNNTSSNRDEKHFEDQAESKNDRTVSVETNSDGLLQAVSYESVPDQDRMQKVSLNASSGITPAVPTGSIAAKGKLPVGGQSGTVAQPPKPLLGPSASGCDVTVNSQRAEGPDLDGGADTVDVISAGVCSEQRSIQVYASVAGAPQYVGGYETGVAGNYAIFAVSPCWLTGGSDLPGTKVTVKAIAVDSSLKELASASRVITLGDDTLAPRVNVISSPARGTKVKTGDKINLKVMATEKRRGGPWQTGVKMIQITAQPGGPVKDPWVNPSALPKACEEKTWEHKEEATYVVPKNPPPIIKICALAQDYFGNESSQCGEFVTGDKWEGTWHAMGTHDAQLYGAGGNVRHQETLDATFAFYVAADGTISGEGRASTEQPPGVSDQCRFTRSPQQFDVPVRIVGKRSATVDSQPIFTLELKPDTVPVTFTSSCPKGTGTTALNWPQGAESQCGWQVTMLAEDPSTKEEETLHACGPNNLTQVKVTIRRAHP